MDDVTLDAAVRIENIRAAAAHRCRSAWQRCADETGVDEAVTKMIWLAVGIVVALAATAFFKNTFEAAKRSVPDPVAP